MGKKRENSPTQQQRLAAACRNGGCQSEIKDLLIRFDYSAADLREALDVLSTTASSALEASQAKKNIEYLEGILRGMTLAGKYRR